MKKFFLFILFLIALCAAGLYYVFHNPMYVLKNVPGLSIEEISLKLWPPGVKIKNASYTTDAFYLSADHAVVGATIHSFKGMREKDPQSCFVEAYVSNAVFEIADSAKDEEESSPKNYEELIRTPFLFNVSFDEVKVRMSEPKMTLALSGHLANAYEGSHYSLTGSVSTIVAETLLPNGGENASLVLTGGLDGNIVRLECKGRSTGDILDLAGMDRRTVTMDEVKSTLNFSSRVDWKLLRNAYPKDLPQAMTNVSAKLAMRVRNMEAMMGKIIVTNLTLRSDLKTENFLKERANYSSQASWLFHTIKGGFDCSCSAITFTNLAPHAINVKESKAVAYLKKNGLVLSNLYLSTMKGQFTGRADISSRKVQGQDSYLPYLELDLKSQDIDIGLFCDLFDLRQNRMDGRLSGELHTAIFGKYVKALKGKLYANEQGTFTLGQAETYLQGMEAGYGKDVANILASRLKKYPYKTASVELSYENKVTTVTFDLEGANDNSHIKLPIHLHSSWMDLLDLAKQFK